ncbi:hypothetical protein BH10PSE9_BH10PSE9_18430 [soil metagenome]
MHPVRAHLAAVAASIVVVIVVSALWLIHFKTYPRGTGFDDLSGVVVPFALLGLTALWLVVRALLEGRLRWRVVTVFIVALAFALAPVLLYCGPVACFMPGPQKYMGWFLVLGVAVAALAHHVVLLRVAGKQAAG